MSFISFSYILFFALVVPLFFWLPQQRRWLLLLIASYIFYAATEVNYVLLIAFSTLIDYVASQRIAALSDNQSVQRKRWLLLSITVNLGVLFVFKYFNFFAESGEVFFDAIGLTYNPALHTLILPVGISFYTFQSMAYTVDVYRRNIQPEKHFGIFATYIAFFPQLVAGPIERAGNMLPQFHHNHTFNYERVVSGLRLILWGAFKKVCIGDNSGVYVNTIYNDVESYSGLSLIIATFFFTFQIYCDFSGYSDIAIGSARVLGFDLMENFRQPYLSQSIREFWRRWHISLSTWFRDYVYIPLGGNRVGFGRMLLNLGIVFVVSGLWHGANWTFVIWGTLHGGFIIIETVYERWQSRPKISQNALTVLMHRVLTFGLVMLAWIFFRANTLDDALYVLQHLFDFSGGAGNITQPAGDALIGTRLSFILLLIAPCALLFFEWANSRYAIAKRAMQIIWLRWLLYYTATLLILWSLARITDSQPFIYFRF